MLCQRISMHIWMSCKMRTNIQFHVNHNLSTIQDDVFDEQLALRWSCMTRCPCIYELFWEKTAYFGGKVLLKMKGSLQINPWNILVQFNVTKLFARHHWSQFMKKTSTCWAIVWNDGPMVLTLTCAFMSTKFNPYVDFQYKFTTICFKNKCNT